jgi:hypothetical protein
MLIIQAILNYTLLHIDEEAEQLMGVFITQVLDGMKVVKELKSGIDILIQNLLLLGI